MDWGAGRRVLARPGSGLFRAIIAFMTSPQDLKDAGLKATLPRLKIINLFEASKVRHLTAEDV